MILFMINLTVLINCTYQGDHEPGKEPGDIVIQLEEKVTT